MAYPIAPGNTASIALWSIVIRPFVLQHESPHAHADGCTFAPTTKFSAKVSLYDASGALQPLASTVAPDGQSVSLPPPTTTGLPQRLNIKITPTDSPTKYWEVDGDVEFAPGLGLSSYASFQTPPAGAKPTPVNFDVATPSLVRVWLSRVRDVTDIAAQTLSQVPPKRAQGGFAPLSTWKIPPATTNFIGDPPVSGGGINVVGPDTVDPDTTDRVFEIQGFQAPKLIAVCWPNSFSFPMLSPGDASAPFPQAKPAPFLIFFHAQFGQNMGGADPAYDQRNGSWPYGWDFLFFGLYHYLSYPGDVVQQWGNLGLPIQIQRSQKSCIVVVPQNHFGHRGPPDEIVEFNDPELVQETLEEIQTHMYFRAGNPFTRPNIGRTAAGSMSNGNVLLSAFLTTNPDKSFLKNILREVYVFDPNGSDDQENFAPVSAAMAWRSRADPNGDKMIRYFAQKVHPVHATLLGKAPPQSGSFVMDGSSANVTGGVLTSNAWLALGAPSDPSGDWQVAHQLIPGMLVTYVFARSGF